ncbi:hypothetical protein YQE_05771, partial [Dendroctonus ponderosae]
MENNAKTFLIPNDLCRRAGMGASWRPMNEIVVFPYEKRSVKQKDQPTSFASNAPVSIFHIRRSVILFHPILRKLVNESNGVFLTLQASFKTKPSDLKMEILSISRQYRSIIRACLENLQDEVIKEVQEMTENGWFVSHFTDLLHHSGRLSSLEKEVEGFSADKLRESFILDYGTTLVGHKSLWQVGLSYLDHCPKDGLPTIQLLLPRISFDSEAKVHKLIREAISRGLKNVAQSICKVQGMRSLSRGRLGNALTWALKSQDGPFTSYLADKYLKQYISSGELNNTDLLDNLGSSMLASDRLIFLGKYNEFHKLYQEGEYKECGHLLIALMVSKIVPKFFWPVLLSEAIPLLESEEIVFSANDTFTVLHCLEEKEEIPELSDKISILRLAAARNLSRALMYEAQCENLV